MENRESHNPGKLFSFSLVGAIASAAAASGTILALSCGFGSAMIGNLQALAPYKPLIMALTLGFLGLACYRLYRKKSIECDGRSCSPAEKNRFARTIFWIGVTLAILLMIGPYVLDAVFQKWNGIAP